MKILRIIYDWPPPWIGLVPQPYEITNFQRKLNHQITVMCGRWPKAGKLETLPGVLVMPIFRAPLQGTIFFTSSVILFFRYLLYRRNNKPDILHMHGSFGYWILVYRNFLHRFFPWTEELKIPLIYHFHITYKGREEFSLKNKKEIKFTSKFFEWPLMIRCDKLASKISSACIATSEEIKKEAIKYYGISDTKCFVVESGVNTNLFKPVQIGEVEKTRSDLGFDMLDKVILNYGYLVERKNIHVLIEALALLPIEYNLLLIGSADPSYLEKLKESIQTLNIASRVRFIGYTDYPQIHIGIQLSDIFVLPSGYEGTPKVVLEALACGKPVLASGFKLTSEITGLRYLKDIKPQTIAGEVEEVLSSEINQKVDINFVHTNFSWERKVQQIEEVYKYGQNNVYL